MITHYDLFAGIGGFSLVLETDDPAELYKAVLKLDKEDEYLTTQNIDLRVQVI